jgi:hypothetical protein
VPSPSTAPAELLAALAGALSALDARWYVFGAQAALEEALSRGDLSPVLEAELARLRK